MKKQGTEFYIGLFIWLLEIPISYSMWYAGSEIDIKPLVSSSNVTFSALLYLIFLAGFLTSHGVFQHQLTRGVKLFGIALSSLTAIGLSMFFFFGMVGLLVMTVIIQVIVFVEQKWALLIGILVPVLCTLLDVWLGKTFEYTEMIVYSTFNVLALLISYRLIAERKAKIESEQLVRELKATQVLLSATTKRDERIRIARDLHDVLGHQLTALSLQLEVASHVKEDEKQRHIQQAKAISGLLLSDVRETVSEIRLKKDLELRESLTALTEGLPGLKVDLIMDLDDSLVDARQGEVIFRCVQEALTNTTKHANASHCKIRLSDDGRHLVLSVEDDGNDDTEIKPGNGLAGMAERVAKIDGQLNYQNTPEGFVLTVKLPKISEY
jgi:signal transduction histidine kinase